jgi:hypothetical protein
MKKKRYLILLKPMDTINIITRLNLSLAFGYKFQIEIHNWFRHTEKTDIQRLTLVI